jgi:hypothetical protein
MRPSGSRASSSGLRPIRVAMKSPGFLTWLSCQDALELQLEDLRVGVERAVHPPRLDERGDSLAR